MSQSGSQPLCVHKVKVSFDGEPGEGSGVLRSLFTAAAEVSNTSPIMRPPVCNVVYNL